jgi:methionyl-tRNA formyltransferase
MRLIFAGTPHFAVPSLRALLRDRHQIALVLTQPDRPAGRGLRESASPVKELALSQGLPLAQPATLREPGVQAMLAAVGADAIVVVAYGLILPPAVLALPPFGCLNVHASLLPRWRGAAPIQRALLAGDGESGVSIMAMDAGLDTGAVYRRVSVALAADETGGSLHDRLAATGAEALAAVLAELAAGTARALPQPAEGVTYATKLDKRETQIDWRQPAAEIDRRIRAFDPFPGAAGTLAGERLKLFRSQALSSPVATAPGAIVAVGREAITVACGDGAVRVAEVQKAGGRRLPVADFIAGNPLRPGTRFD